MNEIMPFMFGENVVRVISDGSGEPWFVAKDVALALGYVWKRAATIGHVPDEWRGSYSVQLPSGEQQMLTLSEQGLYFFVARSDKPAALPFQKWLAGEVLPALRKTGRYEVPGRQPVLEPPASFPPEALRLRPAMRQKLWRDALNTARLDDGPPRCAGSPTCAGWWRPCRPHPHRPGTRSVPFSGNVANRPRIAGWRPELCTGPSAAGARKAGRAMCPA